MNTWLKKQLISAFPTYKQAQAVRLHMSTEYDYFKYNGQVRGTPETFAVAPYAKKFLSLHKKLKEEDSLMFFYLWFRGKVGFPSNWDNERHWNEYREFRELYGTKEKMLAAKEPKYGSFERVIWKELQGEPPEFSDDFVGDNLRRKYDKERPFFVAFYGNMNAE